MFWRSKSELWDYVLNQFGLSSGPIIFQQKCVRTGLEGWSEVPQIQTEHRTQNIEHAVAAEPEHQQQRVSSLLLWLWTLTSEEQQLFPFDPVTPTRGAVVSPRWGKTGPGWSSRSSSWSWQTRWILTWGSAAWSSSEETLEPRRQLRSLCSMKNGNRKK